MVSNATCTEFQLPWQIQMSDMYIGSLVQDCSISIANALEILQYCTKPVICPPGHTNNAFLCHRNQSVIKVNWCQGICFKGVDNLSLMNTANKLSLRSRCLIQSIVLSFVGSDFSHFLAIRIKSPSYILLKQVYTRGKRSPGVASSSAVVILRL